MSEHQDSMRTQAVLRLYCSLHPSQILTFEGQLKPGMTTGTELGLSVVVHPCRLCRNEINQIKSAVKILTESAK